jgi:hypothetical protein
MRRKILEITGEPYRETLRMTDEDEFGEITTPPVSDRYGMDGMFDRAKESIRDGCPFGWVACRANVSGIRVNEELAVSFVNCPASFCPLPVEVENIVPYQDLVQLGDM